jgi:5-methylcytosine-specific restriction endonuclease McrA
MSASVLVLNANYEPVNVCDMHRAIGLILTEKAALIMNGRGEIRTASSTYSIPSVIRLVRMVHRPRPHVKLTRREVFRRDSYTCQYCGKRALTLTVDHVVPRHLGGNHIWVNVVTACSACNHYKGGRTLAESNLRLLHMPKEPPSTAAYLFGRHLLENAEWEQYLAGW